MRCLQLKVGRSNELMLDWTVQGDQPDQCHESADSEVNSDLNGGVILPLTLVLIMMKVETKASS